MLSEIFHELGLHKPDFDETWYDHNSVTRRITACYSRQNDIFEKYDFFLKNDFFSKDDFFWKNIFPCQGNLRNPENPGFLTDPPHLSQKVRDLRTSPRGSTYWRHETLPTVYIIYTPDNKIMSLSILKNNFSSKNIFF